MRTWHYGSTPNLQLEIENGVGCRTTFSFSLYTYSGSFFNVRLTDSVSTGGLFMDARQCYNPR